jgi:hypothetical protein
VDTCAPGRSIQANNWSDTGASVEENQNGMGLRRLEQT